MRKFLRLLLVALLGAAVGLGMRRVVHGKSDRPDREKTENFANRPDGEKSEKQANRPDDEKTENVVNRPDREKPASVEKQPELWVVGYIAAGRRLNVCLSDGRVLTESDESLGRVTRSFAEVDGRRVYLRVPEPRGKSEPRAVAQVEDKTASGPAAGVVLGSWRQDPDGVNRLVEPTALLK